jgi:plasmid stabilization system protein ParE
VARRQLIVTPRAQRQIAGNGEWWRENRHKASDAFDHDLEGAYDLILAHPEVGVMVGNTRRRGARRLHLERIHYDLYYEVTEQAILILALWHSSRRPPRGL